MPTRLVVNADDLGLHPRIDEGILRAHADGVLTSASVLVTGRNAPDAVARARAQGLGLGVHLTLSSGLEPAAPVAQVRWLAPGGRFRQNWREFAQAWLGQLVPAEEVELEWRAQVERLQQLGAEIDHLDTHQHLHLMPGLARVLETLAAGLGVPVRWPAERPRLRWARRPFGAAKSLLLTTLGQVRPGRAARRVRSLGATHSGALDERRLLAIVERLPDGDVELMCHPGLAPGVIPEDPDWRYGWEEELAALTSPRVRARLQERGVELVRFGDLTRA